MGYLLFSLWYLVRDDPCNILSGVHDLLRYHELIGIHHYPRNEAVEKFLKVLPQVAGNRTISTGKTVDGAMSVSRKKEQVTTRSPVSITDIEAEISSCHACDLYKDRIYPVAGRGSGRIRLLVVGDWLSAGGEGNLPPGHLFGVQQDQMLSRMLLAINLSATDVFITNVIKCAVPDSCQPQAVHVESCSSFLRRQIVALLPEVICTMGTVAARAVLERSQPLSRLRGQFYEYQINKDTTCPVIATYHPSYLLQNPEMKQATWADLQLLAKKMGLT